MNETVKLDPKRRRLGLLIVTLVLVVWGAWAYVDRDKSVSYPVPDPSTKPLAIEHLGAMRHAL